MIHFYATVDILVTFEPVTNTIECMWRFVKSNFQRTIDRLVFFIFTLKAFYPKHKTVYFILILTNPNAIFKMK